MNVCGEHAIAQLIGARRSQIPAPMMSLSSFKLPNPSNRIVVLGFTQPLTEMSTRDRDNNLSWGKARPASEADNLAAIYEPTV
jgi:hypothetical protein